MRRCGRPSRDGEAGGAAPGHVEGGCPRSPSWLEVPGSRVCARMASTLPGPLSQEDAECPSSTAFWTAARNTDHLVLGLWLSGLCTVWKQLLWGAGWVPPPQPSLKGTGQRKLCSDRWVLCPASGSSDLPASNQLAKAFTLETLQVPGELAVVCAPGGGPGEALPRGSPVGGGHWSRRASLEGSLQWHRLKFRLQTPPSPPPRGRWPACLSRFGRSTALPGPSD